MPQVTVNTASAVRRIGTFTDKWPYLIKRGHWYAFIFGCVFLILGVLSRPNRLSDYYPHIVLAVGGSNILLAAYRFVFGIQLPHLLLTENAVASQRRRKNKKIISLGDIKQVILWNPPPTGMNPFVHATQSMAWSNALLLLSKPYEELPPSDQKSLLKTALVFSRFIKVIPTRFYPEAAEQIAAEISAAVRQRTGVEAPVCHMTPRGPEPMLTAEEMAEAQAAGFVPRNRYCRRCDYDLRGQRLDAVCPECELPIWESIRELTPDWSDAAWLQCVRRGLSRGIAAAGLIGVTLSAAMARLLWGQLPLSGMPIYLWAALAVTVCCMAVLLLAAFDLTAREPAAHIPDRTIRSHRIVRLSWVLPPVVFFALLLLGLQARRDRADVDFVHCPGRTGVVPRVRTAGSHETDSLDAGRVRGQCNDEPFRADPLVRHECPVDCGASVARLVYWQSIQ